MPREGRGRSPGENWRQGPGLDRDGPEGRQPRGIGQALGRDSECNRSLGLPAPLPPHPLPRPAGTLSYLNHVGMWSKRTSSKERRVSYRRWALKNAKRSVSQQQPDSDHKHTVDLPKALTPSSLLN